MGFLTPPSDHVRDGVSLNKVTADNPEGVFPDGPRPWIAAMQHTTQAAYEVMADHGFTVIACRDGAVPEAYRIAAGAVKRPGNEGGLKFLYSMRDNALPFVHKNGDNSSSTSGHKTNQGIAWALRNSEPQRLKDMLLVKKQAVDYILANPAANDAVIGWMYNFDDYLAHVPDGLEGGASAKDHRDCLAYIMEEIRKYDPKGRVGGDCPAWGGMPNAKLKTDYGRVLNSGPLYYHEWLVTGDLWAFQMFHSYSLSENPGGGGRVGQFEYSNRAARLDRWSQTNANPKSFKKPRIVAPLIYVDRHPKTFSVPEFRNLDFTKKHYLSLMAIRMIAENTGISFYKYLLSYVVGSDGSVTNAEGQTVLNVILNTVRLYNDNKIFHALLWGVRKGGTLNDIAKRDRDIGVGDGFATVSGAVRKIALDSGESVRHAQARCSNMGQGGSTSDTSATGKIPPIGDQCTDNEKGSIGAATKSRNIDPILWIAKQYKDKWYLVVTNVQQHPDETKQLGVNPPSRYHFRSKFTLPDIDTTKVKCTDIISGDPVQIQHDSGGYFVRVDLDPIESAALIFEDATVVPPLTVSATEPASVTKKPGESQVFTATAENETEAHWEYLDKGATKQIFAPGDTDELNPLGIEEDWKRVS